MSYNLHVLMSVGIYLVAFLAAFTLIATEEALAIPGDLRRRPKCPITPDDVPSVPA